VKEPVKVIKVKFDVGGPYPEYDVTELQLWSDGSVTWLRTGRPHIWDGAEQGWRFPGEAPVATS
jgi:hypothetical protein